MSEGSVFLIRWVVVEVLGTEGWILDANYPVKHVGTVAGFPGVWVHTEDARACKHVTAVSAFKVVLISHKRLILLPSRVRYGMFLPSGMLCS